MSVEPEPISHAIVLYVARGRAASPRQDPNAVIAAYGPLAVALLVEVERILKEADATPIDWKQLSLVAAGKLVRAKMHERYPRLSEAALDAIEWKFTFDWR